MQYSLGRHCLVPILLNHLTVAHAGSLPTDTMWLGTFISIFSIMNDILKVDHMILKKKKEEEDEEKGESNMFLA